MTVPAKTAMTDAGFVSRGGTKLAGALDALGLDVTGMRALDAGASTGGFTDCLLTRGAREVVAVDVAYGQLAWTLRNDPRVDVRERTNVRSIVLEEPVDLVVADLAFISLRAVADALVAACRDDGHLVLMVKPQFELARGLVPRGGVVREPAAWADALRSVATAYTERSCTLVGAAASRLVGPKGNREFFLSFVKRGAERSDAEDLITAAIEGAP